MMVELIQDLSSIIEPNFQRMALEYLANTISHIACDYCPGKYWPDNKTGNHTLIIFETEQPLSDTLAKLKKMIRDNVYI